MSARLFQRSRLRRRDSETEFRAFRDWLPDRLKNAKAAAPGFDALEGEYSFYAALDRPDAVQIWFGTRAMGFRAWDGTLAAEDGAKLLYSLADGGIMATLYPAESKVARVHEHHLYLRVRPLSALTTLDCLERDLADLCAYARVSALGAETTWKDRIRVWWLRFTRAQWVEDKEAKKFRKAWHARAVAAAPGAAGRAFGAGAVGAVLRPLGILFVVLVLSNLFGCDLGELQKLLGPRANQSAAVTAPEKRPADGGAGAHHRGR
jgi:hypothetical protein